MKSFNKILFFVMAFSGSAFASNFERDDSDYVRCSFRLSLPKINVCETIENTVKLFLLPIKAAGYIQKSVNKKTKMVMGSVIDSFYLIRTQITFPVFVFVIKK